MLRTVRIGLYADGAPLALPMTTSMDLSVGTHWEHWLTDRWNYALGWRVGISPQRMDPLKAMVQERMLGELWLPITVHVRDANGSDAGPVTPGMLFTGVSDCPSVTWIQAYPYARDGKRPVLAYQLTLSVVSRE